MLDCCITSLRVFVVTVFLTVTSLVPIWLASPVLTISAFVAFCSSFFIIDDIVSLHEHHENLHRLNPSRFKSYTITTIVLDTFVTGFLKLADQTLDCLCSVTWRLVALVATPVVEIIRLKFPYLFELSGHVLVVLLVAPVVLAYSVVRVLQYLAVVLAISLDMLRAVSGPKYISLYVVIASVLVYRFREPLARYPPAVPIVTIVVLAHDFLYPGTLGCEEDKYVDPVHTISIKHEITPACEPLESPARKRPYYGTPSPATPEHASTPKLTTRSTTTIRSISTLSPTDNLKLVQDTAIIDSTLASGSTIVESTTSSFPSITILDPNCPEQKKPLCDCGICGEKHKAKFRAAEEDAVSKASQMSSGAVVPKLKVMQIKPETGSNKSKFIPVLATPVAVSRSEVFKPKVTMGKPNGPNLSIQNAAIVPQPVSAVTQAPGVMPPAAKASPKDALRPTKPLLKPRTDCTIGVSPASSYICNSPSAHPSSPTKTGRGTPPPITAAPSIELRSTPATPTRVALCYVSSQTDLGSRTKDHKSQSALKLSRSRPVARASPMYASLSPVQTREELVMELVARAGSRKHYAIRKGKSAKRLMRASAAAAPALSTELSASFGSESTQLGVTNSSVAHVVPMELDADLNTGVTMEMLMEIDPMAGTYVDEDVWMSDPAMVDTVVDIAPPVIFATATGIVHQPGFAALQSSVAATSAFSSLSSNHLTYGGSSGSAAGVSTGSTNAPTGSGDFLPSGRSRISKALFPFKNIIWSLDEAGYVPAPEGGLEPRMYIWRRDPDRMTPAVLKHAPKRFWIKQ